METKDQSRGFSVLNWLGWFLGLNLLCIVFAALAIWLGWRSYTLTASGEVTEGTVVKLLEEDVSFTTSFTPIFEFQANGETYRVQSQNSYRWWNRYLGISEGSQIEVRYDPANPQTAEINSFWAVWNDPIILGIVTFLFAIGANGYLVMRWRARPQKNSR